MMRPSTVPRKVFTSLPSSHQRDDADEARGAVLDATQIFKQQRVVGGVGGVFSGVTRGDNAGGAA